MAAVTHFESFSSWREYNEVKVNISINHSSLKRSRIKMKTQCDSLKVLVGRGLLISEVAFFLLTLWPQVRFPAFPKIYFDVSEIYQWFWFEESGQRLLDNVDGTHLVPAS